MPRDRVTRPSDHQRVDLQPGTDTASQETDIATPPYRPVQARASGNGWYFGPLEVIGVGEVVLLGQPSPTASPAFIIWKKQNPDWSWISAE
ncbi:uncharacterized protein TrAtP1_002332 [Trichoderma atroviride]|uniref:uncharacterized protein n=1 Tax=Hypocrea atroviridis TaxID=63577 RepID=UPI00331C2068|nr:hypothetical protein TrAtP1_002332 [Trichoderma atroviride]